MDIQVLYDVFKVSKGVSIDTRQDLTKKIFFGIQGDHFDGNDFVDLALKKGASHVVTNRKAYLDDNSCFVVDDPQHLLQELAKYHRTQLQIPVIGITGSNGKTTTKELINAVLSQKYKTLATKGNYNNHIGVPLTLLEIEPDTEVAIIEMGANHVGEIKTLCEIAQPNFGMITNFGKAHLEGFKTKEGVINGKTELYRYLKNAKGIIFYNLKDSVQLKHIADYKYAYSYSEDKSLNPYFLIEDFDTSAFLLRIKLTKEWIQSQLYGAYNLINLVAALTIGHYFRVDIKAMSRGIQAYIPKNNRSQWIQKPNVSVLLDAYNANPSSMAVAIEAFGKLKGDKVLVLGDMLELGDKALEEHQNIVNQIDTRVFKKVFLVGDLFSKVKVLNASFFQFSSYNRLEAYLSKIQWKNNEKILLKASRKLGLERLIGSIKE